MVANIATGEAEEKRTEKEYTRKAGVIGGNVRATKLSPKKRKEIAQKAAKDRWTPKYVSSQLQIHFYIDS
jgi:hypothetical protein